MSPITQKLGRLIGDMQALEAELFKYERRYRLRSSVFYRLAQEGSLEQSVDLLKWLGLYETLQDREREYSRLLESDLMPMVSIINREVVRERAYA